MSERSVRLSVRGKSGVVIYQIRGEPTLVLGVPGFAFHRLNGDRSQWVLSHTDTGARIGRGRTKEAAHEDATVKAQTKGRLLAEIEKVRGVVRRAEE